MRKRNLMRLILATLERIRNNSPTPCPDVHGPDLSDEEQELFELRQDIDEILDMASEEDW
jgi:hypothetical protein